MELKHTPGPWLIVERKDPVTISNWSIKIGEKEIGFFPYVYQYADEEKTRGGYVACETWHANARLIAAAPDLMKALKDIIDYWDSVVPELLVNEHHKNGRDAIAKATGEK